MEALEKAGEESPLSQYLHDALSKTDAGDYTEALSLLKPAKSLEPRNVYILAFEKQLEQLIEFKQRNILSDDQRADIVESLPGIIERALEGTTAQSGEGGAPRDPQLAEQDRERSAEERSAAFEWLKNQYFQHAHEHVRKGEYQNALGEIRRVYIIDPGNKVARDFERHIQLAAKLQAERIRVQDPKAAQASKVEEPSPPPQRAPEPAPVASPEGDVIPVKTEEWSSPTPAYTPTLRGPMAHEETEKSSSTMIVVLLVLAILVAVGAGLFFWGRQNTIRKGIREPSGSLSAPAEPSYAALGQTSEQTYVVSSKETEPGTKSPQVTNLATTPSSDGTARRGSDRSATTNPGPSMERGSLPVREASGSREEAPAVVKAEDVRVPAGAPQSESASGTAPAFVAVEKSAEVIKLEKPRFPDFAYAQGLVGQVTVQVQVNAEGKPIKTRILKSTNPSLDDSVIEAVMKSKFLPGQMASGPVTSWLTIPFRFEASH